MKKHKFSYICPTAFKPLLNFFGSSEDSIYEDKLIWGNVVYFNWQNYI